MWKCRAVLDARAENSVVAAFSNQEEFRRRHRVKFSWEIIPSVGWVRGLGWLRFNDRSWSIKCWFYCHDMLAEFLFSSKVGRLRILKKKFEIIQNSRARISCKLRSSIVHAHLGNIYYDFHRRNTKFVEFAKTQIRIVIFCACPADLILNEFE